MKDEIEKIELAIKYNIDSYKKRLDKELKKILKLKFVKGKKMITKKELH